MQRFFTRMTFMNHSCRILLLLASSLLLLQSCAGTDEQYLTDRQDAERLYTSAYEALKSARFEYAIQHFKLLETRYPFSPYALQTQLDLAYAYLLYGREAQAVSEIDRFLRFNPTHSAVDYAYYIRGLANFRHRKSGFSKFIKTDHAQRDQQHLQDAFNDFSTLIRRFPNSPYAADARQRLIYLRNLFAGHEISVASFYLRNEAWVAAINRAQNILYDFYQTPHTHEALVIMHTAYKQLGVEHITSDIDRILKLNFPDDPYLEKKAQQEQGPKSACSRGQQQRRILRGSSSCKKNTTATDTINTDPEALASVTTDKK